MDHLAFKVWWEQFCGDAVLDSFNKASWHEDNISDLKYVSKYIWIFILKILDFEREREKMHINEIQPTKNTAYNK